LAEIPSVCLENAVIARVSDHAPFAPVFSYLFCVYALMVKNTPYFRDNFFRKKIIFALKTFSSRRKRFHF